MCKKIFSLLLMLAFFSDLIAKELNIIYAARMRDITDKKYGTYGNLSALVKSYRQKGDTIFIFGGNSFGPSLISNMDNGSHIINILNNIYPDVLGVNYSDLMFSIDELSLRAEEANFPFILSNVKGFDVEGVFNLLPSVIIKKEDFTIGVISVLGKESRTRYSTGVIEIEDELETIQKQSKILREKGVDFIILLTTGYYQIPKKITDEKIVDFVLSKYIDSPLKSDERKNVINIKEQDKVGIITLQKNDNGVKILFKKQSLLSCGSDEKIDNIISNYTTKINSFMDQVIGVTKVDLNTKRLNVRNKENIFANLLADAIRHYSKADISVINGGAIRGNKIYKAGTLLTRRDIVKELPFRNKVVLLKIKGKKILEILEHGLSNINVDSGKFLHLSGAKMLYNTDLKSGKRVVKVSIGNKELKKDKLYLFSTIDFLYDGGDNFNMMKNSERIRNYKLDYRLLANVMIDYILEVKDIDMQLEKRLQNIAKDEKNNEQIR